MKTPKYKLTNLILNYIVKYELSINDIKYHGIPDKYKIAIEEKFGAEDIENLGELISYPVGYNKALLIQRGQEMPSQKKTFKIFTNFRNAKDFVKSYDNSNALKPSMDLAVHIDKLVMKGIVDDWDIGKIRGFSEKPNEIYDTWYKRRDFYPHLEAVSHFNEIFDWIQNGKDSNHRLIKMGILLYEFIDKAPFTTGNQITAILILEMLAKKYGYNPDNIIPFFKSVNSIGEDMLSAFKISKSNLDLTTFLEAFLYTISLSAIEVSKEVIDTHMSKVKKRGALELTLNSRQIKLLDYLAINQKVTRSKVTKMMGVSFMTSFRDLQDMIEKGYITAKGKGRGTYYVLSKEMIEKDDDIIIKEIE
jgi:Fic family protein